MKQITNEELGLNGIEIIVSARGCGKEEAMRKHICELANDLGATKDHPLKVAVMNGERLQRIDADNVVVETIKPKVNEPLSIPLPPCGRKR